MLETLAVGDALGEEGVPPCPIELLLQAASTDGRDDEGEGQRTVVVCARGCREVTVTTFYGHDPAGTYPRTSTAAWIGEPSLYRDS